MATAVCGEEAEGAGGDLGREYRLRVATAEDAADMGRIGHRAFLRFNKSVDIPPHVDAGGFRQVDPEDDSFFIAQMKVTLLSTFTYGVVAVCNSSDQMLGGALLNYTGEGVHSISLVFVDPDHSNRGVATSIVRKLRDHALHTHHASSIRLLQGAHNTKSFCVYAKLGFNPVETVSYFEGRLDPEKDSAACLELGIKILHDVEIRPMLEGDVPACAALFKKTMGYPREVELRAVLASQPGYAWVVVHRGEEALLSFTTGFHQSGFSVSVNEESFVALFRHVSHEWPPTSWGPDPTVHIPSRLHPKLALWAIRSGLQLIRHQWIMVYGDYEGPQLNFVYCPGILL